MTPPLCRRYTAGQPILTPDEVRAIRTVYRKGHQPTFKQIAKYYGITEAAVHGVVHGRTHKGIT